MLCFANELIFALAMCFLVDDIYEYPTVSQGKITIPGMDDGEEFQLTDVSLKTGTLMWIIYLVRSISFSYAPSKYSRFKSRNWVHWLVH